MSRRCALRLRLALRRCPPLALTSLRSRALRLRLALRRPPLRLPCAIAAKCSTRSMTRLARRPRCPPLPSCRGFVLYAFGLHFAGVHRSLALHVDDIGGVHRHGVTLAWPAQRTARKWQNGGDISIAMIGAFSGVDEKSEVTLLLVIEPPSRARERSGNFGRIVFTGFARRSAFGGKVNDGPYWCSVLFLKFLKSLFSILAPHFFTLTSRHKRGGLRPPRDE